MASRMTYARKSTGRSFSRPIPAAISALAVALAVAGCVSMPTAGPVLTYPVTQGPDAQSEPYQQVILAPPAVGWLPQQIVQGFLTASASFGDNWQVARQYLTPQASRAWKPSASWSAVVYSKGPDVAVPVYTVPSQDQATVTVTGSVLAQLSGYGSYAVPSSSAPQGSPGARPTTIALVKVGGQWRISSPPSELLLTNDSFKSDYQLRNLYFFDPASRFLVPDPVYVPLQATPADLMNGLVQDLVRQPDDWLSGGATHTSFPPGSTGDVTLDGVTAVVDLGGAITKASAAMMQQVSAQLVWTLSGAGQGSQAVQSVEVEVNDKPWLPPGGSQGNPVQRGSRLYNPPTGASETSDRFYYLDGGNVMSNDVTQGSQGAGGPPVTVERVGTGYTEVAVSPDGKYLAVIGHDGDLSIGRVGGPLTKRSGSSYTTMSWDPDGNLWATMSNQIVMLRGAVDQGQPTAATVVNSDGSSAPSAPITAVRVGPDGVRVAIVIGDNELDFGAISWQEEASGKPLLRIVVSPFTVPSGFYAKFISLTWYGPDNVITLTTPGPAATEYPVNGGAATSISTTAGMQSLTAIPGSALIAGLAKDKMVTDASLTGSWLPIVDGLWPAYPG